MFKIKSKEVLALLLYAIPNTLLSFGIIHIINNALAGNQGFLQDYMIIVFLSIVGYTYLLNITFQKKLNEYAFKILYKNEKQLFSQILNAPLQALEKFGSQRFYTAMEDLRIFSQLPYTVTHTVSSLLMLILGVVYMFTLSASAASVVIALIFMVAGCYFIVMRSMASQVGVLRKHNDEYYRYVRDLLGGFKELKLSLSRRYNLLNKFLAPNRDNSEKLDFKINYVFLSINMISQYGLYFVIAIILFGLPMAGLLDRDGVIAYVVVILFISGPINNLINLQQIYTRFFVANTRLNNFMKDFNIEVQDAQDEHDMQVDFKSLRFEDVSFSYHNDLEEKTFALGPVNLEIHKGEVLFIVGGNGSGKSTFINLLTGLYEPSSGRIILNESTNTTASSGLQESLSAIFTDNHIFSHNYDDYTLEGNENYASLLKTMELTAIVGDDKEESARRKFSKGQSKRMSMIFSLLEKKPILVLDEWAADQDPSFRRYFYEELIPYLKEQGKTIIAVTHDDAYFHAADRIVKFSEGKIVNEFYKSEQEKLADKIW